MRFFKIAALTFSLLSLWIGAASAQQVSLYCWISNGPPMQWGPCNSANPLQITGTIITTPGGTQNVNLTQVLGAAPSVTNPLWVFPATGATFPISGTVTANIGNSANTTPILVQSSFTPTNITTSTTTTIKSGGGVIHGVTINSKGTIASTVTIYDNTAASGTKIATIDSLNLSGSFFYDAGFSTGLTVVTTGTLAPDITVLWR